MSSHNITVIDCGISNIHSVMMALKKCGANNIKSSSSPEDVFCADKIILPGVGAFKEGMLQLRSNNLIEPIKEFAKTGKPVLGICLGMQMLATSSEENGYFDGLNIIPGVVNKIPSSSGCGHVLKVPFIGWSELIFENNKECSHNILKNLIPSSYVYLVHSYSMHPDNKELIIATYEYNGVKITAAVQLGNVVGFQFHPEKSAKVGLDMLKTFVDW